MERVMTADQLREKLGDGKQLWVFNYSLPKAGTLGRDLTAEEETARRAIYVDYLDVRIESPVRVRHTATMEFVETEPSRREIKLDKYDGHRATVITQDTITVEEARVVRDAIKSYLVHQLRSKLGVAAGGAIPWDVNVFGTQATAFV